MKKIIGILMVTSIPFSANAQHISPVNEDVFNVLATILVVGLCMLFIIAILKLVADNRLKNKIIDKGIPENVASSILQKKLENDRSINIKWFIILTGLGVGFTIIYYTLPLGIHSLAIISFCLAASFLLYSYILPRLKK
jgi:TRAP-type C4-dicarboxylate transport system permease small subunit